MTYVITQNCCNDAACAQVCPVGCIHPTPDEPGYSTAEMLYIDPQKCIDCGACVEACPVDAVYSADELPHTQRRYADINAAYFRATPHDAQPETVTPRREPAASGAPLRVAIVGAGPSGFYAAEQLLADSGVPVEVSMFDRLPTPFGLVRAGVAPDHVHTKAVTGRFRWTAARKNFHTFYNVEIGRDISHDELLAHHHAVLYSVGALDDRRLGIPGEDLPGSHGASEFVAWYNGHPDQSDRAFDFSHQRAVVVGNGNVALDIARILLLGVDRLAQTDIADHALQALAHSSIEEVVVLGRRGPAQAAFTTPELLALRDLDGIDVVVDLPDERIPEGFTARLKAEILAEYASAPRLAGKRIVLRFLESPVEVVGADRAEGLRIARNRLVDRDGAMVAEPSGDQELLAAGLVLRAVGFRGRPVEGVPFDDRSATIANAQGRVIDPADGKPVTGVYTAGWIKRGPSGVIGTNKQCAAETVGLLLADHAAGRLAAPVGSAADLTDLVTRRQPHYIDRRRWQAIDEHELAAGRAAGRPAVKLTSAELMLEIAAQVPRDA
ncbi:4Fe-4S dicluster domain-containing protein [Nocardia yunnanensis]|uniref:4Fe-4S dicluster domain-containing protein n=1 Tax=Nocardia yunnanensis TaxID=2382165 RepID=A0A386ZCD2_9NOCA|nr:4Fe-4S binding protein [Nocardia yunnanensis]AYF75321.1 4Fe-4S dicluster domain-containing protein [Nocardia yunnanensis]